MREFLTRDEWGGALHSRQYPVIVFTGPRGIGKTALLSELAWQLDQKVPYARIDCGGFTGGARELLPLVAFDLNRRSGGYGTLAFPRLITGQIAIAAPLDLTDREIARAQIRQVLEDYKRTGRLLQQAFSDILDSGFDALGQVHGTSVAGPVGIAVKDAIGKAGPKLVLGGLVATRGGRRLVLGKGQDWYGHQDQGLGRSALDVLVDLNQMVGRPDVGDNRREAAELLWAAFLADLRDSFKNSRRAIGWTLNCVLLLDNVDTKVGHDFLNELIMARREHAAYAPEEPDPLTVVAVSRGNLAERVCASGHGIVDLAEASYPGYLRRQTTPTGRWWYAVRLPDLTRDEAGNMVSKLGLPGGSRHLVTSAVHRFTGGHPGSTRTLLDAVAEHPGNPAGLRAILASPEPGLSTARRRTVEEGLLCPLRAGIPDEAVEDLVTCAAARNKKAALHLAAESGLLTETHDQDSVIFASDLWRSGDAGASILHPVLGRLLTRCLARRTADDPASWTVVHRWLRSARQDAGDEAGELYHALALGDFEYVARHFATSLESAGVAQWRECLEAVAAAPNRLDHQEPYTDQIRVLTKWADQRDLPVAPVARLIATGWIEADPMSDRHRPGLLRKMAADLDSFARYSTDMDAIREWAQACRAAADSMG
ncbi:MAG TPA: hypothetical protein VGI74_12335 [Streptosporangiaceae bacterium]